jgi:hypothetical protein
MALPDRTADALHMSLFPPVIKMPGLLIPSKMSLMLRHAENTLRGSPKPTVGRYHWIANINMTGDELTAWEDFNFNKEMPYALLENEYSRKVA